MSWRRSSWRPSRAASGSFARRARLGVLDTRQPAGSPECESVGATKRERGRQTTAILISIRQPSGARVRCSVSAEGATSSSAGLRSHPAAFRAPGCRRSGPRTAALPNLSGAAARRASVRGIATAAQPRSPAPESEESYPRDDAANGKQRRLNRATNLAPLQTLSCCVPLSGKAARSMGAVAGAGIRSSRNVCAPIRHAREGEHPRKSKL